MNSDDIAQVMDIERESFPSMWPQTAYRRELQNKVARYLVVAELRDEPRTITPSPGLWGTLRRIVGNDGDTSGQRVLGFIGLWLLVGEAHIVTVAVRDSYRRMGIGERLLIAAIDTALEYDQDVLTLEVRKSNDAAQQLYLKYGFDRVGLRKRYYTDNNEDAVLMTTPEISTRAFLGRFEALKQEHRANNPDLWS
jgi:ribosomal-protein-alanine N-acetyltransferase